MRMSFFEAGFSLFNVFKIHPHCNLYQYLMLGVTWHQQHGRGGIPGLSFLHKHNNSATIHGQIFFMRNQKIMELLLHPRRMKFIRLTKAGKETEVLLVLELWQICHSLAAWSRKTGSSLSEHMPLILHNSVQSEWIKKVQFSASPCKGKESVYASSTPISKRLPKELALISPVLEFWQLWHSLDVGGKWRWQLGPTDTIAPPPHPIMSSAQHVKMKTIAQRLSASSWGGKTLIKDLETQARLITEDLFQYKPHLWRLGGCIV